MDNTESFPTAISEPTAEASALKARIGALIRYGLLAIGVAGAAWLLSSHWEGISTSLRALGWTAIFYLTGSGLAHLVNTWAWRTTILERPLSIPFGALLTSRLAGEALNKTTPSGSFGGEPLKAYLLIWRGVKAEKAYLSILLSRHLMAMAQIVFILIGVGLAISLRPEKQSLFIGFAVFPGIVLTVVIVATLVDLVLRRTRPGYSETPRKGFFGMLMEASDFFWYTPGAFFGSFGLFLAGWATGVIEILIATHLLGIRIGLSEAIALEGLVVSVNMATFLIPGNVGSQEGAFAMLAPFFGLSAAEGVTLAVLRRLRDVVWVILGLGFGAQARKPVPTVPQESSPA